MQNSLLNEGLILMLAGMGTVFVFLTALVVAMSLMSSLAARFVRADDTETEKDDVIAAIAAAITQHRRK
jgi:oxaloacetate decarboxylase gamma subunit